MVGVRCGIIIFIVIVLISSYEGRKLYEDNQNDEDDSLDCNDGRKIDDPILVPFFEKLREQEMIPSRMKEWVIYFDGTDQPNLLGNKWNQTYLTEDGLNKENQGLPFGRVFYTNGINVYFPTLQPISDEWTEFRVMYAEQLLLDAMESVKLYIKYDPTNYLPSISRSATRILQKILKHGNVKKVYVVTTVCEKTCKKEKDNPLIRLATCGSAFGKVAYVECKQPQEDVFMGTESSRYKKIEEPEFQVDLPNKLKQEFHKIMDWLLNRISQRMRNYMEMAFAKNRFRKTPTDLYNKVNLQISKIRGGQTFEASRSSELIYNSLFDLNVYLNVTNTPFTFDKFASFNRYLTFIGRFSKWYLDTGKYTNFFEPLKEICLRYIGSGSLLMKPATKIFELEEGVYDLIGSICHENILYIVNGLTTMNTIKSGIYDNEDCQFDTVFVLAKKNFTINEDLRIKGKNLVVFSPIWIIVKEQTIDLSGEDGKMGEAGGPGGDFFGFGVKFEKSPLLTVVSNGGDGGAGRNATQVSDERFFTLEGEECVPRRTKELIRRYGATRGAPGGDSGSVTLKIIRNLIQNLTVIQNHGENGKDGVLKNVIVNCGKKTATVSGFNKRVVTGKDVQKLKESDVLELFRKVIRKNSRRLSYEVLTFYKDIWTSPLMRQTLDSTLRDFLNASDYTKDSREYYDITSQILHTQLKYSCNMSKPQRVLLDFALTTIRMESPIEGVLPSVIDIDSYLSEVSERVGKSEIRSEYFEKKEAKFRNVIEEANNYLRVSLLPSLRETIEKTQYFLWSHKSDYVLHDVELFEENLVMNALLRHMTTLFEHIHFTLDDFVILGQEGDSAGVNSEGLKRKLYFYREARNNMTVNEMNAMREFLTLLKTSVEFDAELEGKPCLKCRKDMDKVVEKLLDSEPRKDDCSRIVNELQGKFQKRSQLRSRLRSDSCETCTNCRRCPWCEKCRPRGAQYDPNEDCLNCANCYRCPSCKKCQEDPNQYCDLCQNCHQCPECPQCIAEKYCYGCSDCSLCPNCPQCWKRIRCEFCPNCPECRRAVRRGNHRFLVALKLCETCPCSVCHSCPKCRLRPAYPGEFDEIDRDDVFGWDLYSTTESKELAWIWTWKGDQHTKPPIIITPGHRRNDVPQDDWRDCLTSVGSHLDRLFESDNYTCTTRMETSCSNALNSLRELAPEVEDEKPKIRLKCPNCNDTLEYFIIKLSSEMEKCMGDSSDNYREVESFCAPNEGVVFHIRGCDPETFSRTYDEIHGNFLKEFSHFVDGESSELSAVQKNFAYLLTNVEMLLSEGMPLSSATLNGILHVTDSLVKYKDLKNEYEKKVTELHDFSETDVYDLFTAELSMQNERLDLTSKWLSQMKKLMPWMRKATNFLSTNSKFQEVNEKILEAVRLVSEIVHNVKTVEHYRHLREYLNGVQKVDKMRSQEVWEFKPVFEKMFINDVYNKAVRMAENWMFPLSKSLTELRHTLADMKNETNQARLSAVATEIENHRKSISLYTTSQSAKTLFYKWNIRTRPTLLDELFDGKPVILVSEILDGGRLNSLMAKNFEMKLVAGRRQKEGAQEEIDSALAGSWLNITHSGISYFKFGSRIYRRLTETFNFRHEATTTNRTVEWPRMDYVLSPYTTWILRLELETGRFPVDVKNKIGRIELYGTGRYVVNCADIPDVNQNFTPLTDYRRRNGK